MKTKKKVFTTREEKKQFVEDYKKKMKTELCKNWELKGSCKYGEKVNNLIKKFAFFYVYADDWNLFVCNAIKM